MKSDPKVNSEPKVFASLSSGLLARKGAARPAMRPQGFGQGGGALEDLGWDDMGFEPPKAVASPLRDETHDAFGEELEEQPLRNPVAALTPVQSPVHSQQAELAGRLSEADEEFSEEGEDFDETAELYEPEDVPELPPVAVESPVAPVPTVASVRSCAALRSVGWRGLAARLRRYRRVSRPAASRAGYSASSA